MDTWKAYACTKCNDDKEFQTNHYGNIYNTFCTVCNTLAEWYCTEEVPEGGWVPPAWAQVKGRTDTPNQFPHSGDLGLPSGTTESAVCIALIVYKNIAEKGKEKAYQDVKDGNPPMWVCHAIGHAAGGDGFMSAAATVVLIAFCRGELDPKGGTN
jgi:hypothetical protein